MEQKEIQLKKIEVITNIFCDCCGKSCKVIEDTVENSSRVDDGEKFYGFEFLKLHANWGFDSNKDTETWDAYLCEKCVDEKLGFIKFNKTNYL